MTGKLFIFNTNPLILCRVRVVLKIVTPNMNNINGGNINENIVLQLTDNITNKYIG